MEGTIDASGGAGATTQEVFGWLEGSGEREQIGTHPWRSRCRRLFSRQVTTGTKAYRPVRCAQGDALYCTGRRRMYVCMYMKASRSFLGPFPLVFFLWQADDAGLADTKDKEKAERAPVGPQHVLRWFGEVATHVKTQVDKVGLVNSLAPCGLVVSLLAPSLRMLFLASFFCFLSGFASACARVGL